MLHHGKQQKQKSAINLTIGCMATPRSIIETNLRTIGCKLHIDQANRKTEGYNKLKRIYEDECTERDNVALSLIGELRGYLKGNYTIAGFDPTEIKALLHLICMQFRLYRRQR